MARIAVIGSGASALSTIEGALDADSSIQIDLFDPWNELPQFNEATFAIDPTQIAKKSKFGSLAMYEYPSESIIFDKDLHIPLSGTVGGLTSVWGANSLNPDSKSLAKLTERFTQASVDWVTDFAQITNLAKTSDPENFYISYRFRNLLDKYTKRNGVSLDPATLSMNTNVCTRLGGCLSGCRQHAIFSAETRIYELIRRGKVKLFRAFVQRVLTENGSNLGIEAGIDSDKKVVYFGYDKVFVACGAIASCALLQRSGLAPKKVSLRDTQVFYSAYYLWEKRNENSKSLELAQLFVRKSDLVHVSIYEFSSQFLDRARLIIGPFVKLIPKRFWSHIVAGIGFINSTQSGTLILEYKNQRTFVTQQLNRRSKREIRKCLSVVRGGLTRIGLFQLPFLMQVPNVGASYHVGVANVHGEALFATSGKIQNYPQFEVFVMDSSSLAELPVGPITATVMAAAYGRTKLALSNE
jgi:hypothetical protein